jgi:hypothetical protein
VIFIIPVCLGPRSGVCVGSDWCFDFPPLVVGIGGGSNRLLVAGVYGCID